MRIPLPPPTIAKLLSRTREEKNLYRVLEIGPVVDGRYLHWDEVRHRPPPDDLTPEEWWLGIKLARSQLLKPIPLEDREGRSFSFGTPDHVLRLLHETDRDASGKIGMGEEITNPATRDRYIVSSLIAESITSSQLEGASTTTEVAKGLLRSGRKPVDRNEQMILNNYNAMVFVREHSGRPLTPGLVLELHRIVTTDTLDDPLKAGRFRDASDDIKVVAGTGEILHVSPPPDQLPGRLEAMCLFANELDQGTFIHPVVRAILLHFWLAYDHPFVDGNGRTARALFYWSMISQGYWLAEYISISTILRGAPARYARSFLYSETDENDITYFLDYQLKVIRRAIDELQRFLTKKVSELRRVEALLRESVQLNHRQFAILGHALRHPGHQYTIDSHRRSHSVVYQTARVDLLDLAQRGLLIQSRSGKVYVFRAPSDLGDRLEAMGREHG